VAQIAGAPTAARGLSVIENAGGLMGGREWCSVQRWGLVYKHWQPLAAVARRARGNKND
jgi:hypothetical protein